ncbi:hypothetical protein [Neobacillus niacini]|uniref:hypothetical protein n=1 Tax=Neobacillus niacini TaxID=86668 RepID=UPI0021CB304E|nr:hypothetical protein [Neobacillus niacini]MCM3763424.1 hypothetical protein [Neobacillus niacini]
MEKPIMSHVALVFSELVDIRVEINEIIKMLETDTINKEELLIKLKIINEKITGDIV